jgi:replicative DNA helicase
MPNNLPEDKIIYSQRAERALIGSLIIDSDAVFDVLDVVGAADFYSQEGGAIFQAISETATKADGRAVDVLALAEQTGLDVARLAAYVNEVPTSINARRYAEIIADRAARRRMLAAAGQIATMAHDTTGQLVEAQDKAEHLLFAARGRFAYAGVEMPNDYLMAYMDAFERQANEEGRVIAGLSTGLTDLDKFLNGLSAPHQYILAGRPGMGKSALGTHIADNLARHGKRVLFFSLEMSAQQIVQRRLASATRIPLEMIQKPWTMPNDKRALLYDASGRMAQQQFFIDTSPGVTPAQVRAKANRIYAEHGLDLIVIDHLHLMRPDVKNTRHDQDFNEITQALAELAKRLSVPILTLAQLNRSLESRQDKRPMLADLRESGAIEENAYAVMFLYRDSLYNELSDANITKVIVAKNRDGVTGDCDIYSNLSIMHYADLSRQPINLVDF